MTPKQADKLIRAGRRVLVRDAYGDEFEAVFVRRDRRSIESRAGGKFERSDQLDGLEPDEVCLSPGGQRERRR